MFGRLIKVAFCKLKVDWTLSGWMVSGGSCSPDGHYRGSQKCKACPCWNSNAVPMSPHSGAETKSDKHKRMKDVLLGIHVCSLERAPPTVRCAVSLFQLLFYALLGHAKCNV